MTKFARYVLCVSNQLSAVLRERYLRDDVACGVHGCTLCTDLSSPAVLPSAGSLEHNTYRNGHFLLPDTNVFLAQVSLIYHQDSHHHEPPYDFEPLQPSGDMNLSSGP